MYRREVYLEHYHKRSNIETAYSMIKVSGHPAMVGFVSGLLGLLLVVPAYWSGLPIVLGTAGALLGQAGRGRAVAVGGVPVALWAIVVGAAAVILDLLIFVVDRFT